MLLLPYAPNLVLLAQLLAMYATARALRASGLVPFPAFSVARWGSGPKYRRWDRAEALMVGSGVGLGSLAWAVGLGLGP
eukprot:353284-Chlamydomonas_euryale.AAC.11